MKKIIALAFSLILSVSLAACGNNSNMGNDISGGMSSIGSTIESATDSMTDNNNRSSNAKITRDEAKSIAIKHAGIDEANIIGLNIELDRDNGVLKYEVNFHSGNFEYDYDINAETGEIISSQKDAD